MKIYTRTGDDGTTGLIGGQRVSKSDGRIECIGAVDEVNAAVGWVAVIADDVLSRRLRAVQEELFVIGAQLAAPGPPPPTLPTLDTNAIALLETEMDAADAELAPLRNFILPGGSETAARLHLARAVCRRAERLLVSISAAQTISPDILIYLNRLSDWLFVRARRANHLAGVPDVPWNAR